MEERQTMHKHRHTADADADGGTDPGTQQTQKEERTTQAQPQTPGQAATASDGEVTEEQTNQA